MPSQKRLPRVMLDRSVQPIAVVMVTPATSRRKVPSRSRSSPCQKMSSPPTWLHAEVPRTVQSGASWIVAASGRDAGTSRPSKERNAQTLVSGRPDDVRWSFNRAGLQPETAISSTALKRGTIREWPKTYAGARQIRECYTAGSVDDAATGERGARDGQAMKRHPDAYVDLIAGTERLSETDIIAALVHRTPGRSCSTRVDWDQEATIRRLLRPMA